MVAWLPNRTEWRAARVDCRLALAVAVARGVDNPVLRTSRLSHGKHSDDRRISRTPLCTAAAAVPAANGDCSGIVHCLRSSAIAGEIIPPREGGACCIPA